MAMFHRIESVSLADIGKMLKNIYGGVSSSENIQKNDTPPTMIVPGFC